LRRRAASDYSRGLDPRRGIADALDLPPERVAQHSPHVAAGQRVEADERGAVALQAVAAQPEQRRADMLGHPRVHAVRDHVVEAPERPRGDVTDIEPHVAEPERLDSRPAATHRGRVEVEPDELGPGERIRHRHEVPAVAAAQLQHPAALHVARPPAEEPRKRGEAVRMRLRERGAGIRDLVV
jgi:hypothetical protein